MKTSNPVIDAVVESQNQFVSNWMESAKKIQSSFEGGHIASEGQTLYKEYFDKQMNVFKNFQKNTGNILKMETENPMEFFKNWFNKKASYAKSMTEFNQNIQNNIWIIEMTYLY